MGCLLAGAASQAQDKATKMAIINIQIAIAQSNDGQKAAQEIQARFAPKQKELTAAQTEINSLQDQLKNQEKTLSDDARNKLLKSIDDKTRIFNRNGEDFQTEMQSAEQDAINEIGQKMMAVLSDYSQKNSFSVVLDVSSPQTPVLYADNAINITQAIVDLYNQSTAPKPATTGSTAPAPSGAAPKPAAPAAAAPAGGGAKPAGTP
jgi:outer membrane protein